MKASEDCGTENDACQNFADDLGLAHFDKQIAQELSESYEEQKKEEDAGQVRVGHEGKDAAKLQAVVKGPLPRINADARGLNPKP